ncbi:uncharacterized protein LOC142241648 [Haematobia irritans]|uniref:uncharacterized protein LOC142241648 n=1 Tax=Haematobia irritans TaxID=7368 RepID=UPI003F4F7E0E
MENNLRLLKSQFYFVKLPNQSRRLDLFIKYIRICLQSNVFSKPRAVWVCWKIHLEIALALNCIFVLPPKIIKIYIFHLYFFQFPEFAKYHQYNTKYYIALPLFLSLIGSNFNRLFQCVEIWKEIVTKIELPSSLIHPFMLNDYNC